MTFRHLLLVAIGALLTLPALAQEDEIMKAALEVRGDYHHSLLDGWELGEHTQFTGEFINLKLDGKIAPKFSYSIRHRINKTQTNSNFFDATDWIYLTYSPNQQWDFSAGKQVVAVGGYEYDYSPIDVYQYSEYANHVECYEFGLTAKYNFKNGRDHLVAQVTQSPFRAFADNMYAYHLMWRGNHGMYSTLWSVNMMEYRPGKFVNHIALGNRFDFCPNAYLLLDYTNRYAGGYDASFFGDFTLTSELHVRPIKALKIFAKYAYEHNDDNAGDDELAAGTNLNTIGGGIEYFPLGGKDKLRLHAAVFHTWGTNTHTAPCLYDGMTNVSIGLTWRADLLHWKRKG